MHYNHKSFIHRSLGPKSPYTFFKRFRCQHNTRHKAANPDSARRRKNTECPYSMTIRISKSFISRPCSVVLQWCHNHPLNSLQVNTFSDILPETAEKVKSYFDSGFSPGMLWLRISLFYFLLEND